MSARHRPGKPRSRSLGSTRAVLAATVLALGPAAAHAGEPETAAPTEEAAPAPAPAPAPADGASGTGGREGMNDPGLWRALAGNELQLTLSDGSFRGKLMGMQGSQLVFARSGDGLVVSVPASEVMRVHAPIDRPRHAGPLPVDNGGGLIAGGGVLLGIGIPAVVAGAVMAGICGGCLFIYLPLLLPGGAMVGAGSGMLKVGVDRKRMWEAATYGGRLSADFGPPMRLRGMTLRF